MNDDFIIRIAMNAVLTSDNRFKEFIKNEQEL